MQRCELHLHNETLDSKPSYVVTRGIPMPPGKAANKVTDGTRVKVTDDKGKTLPSATKVLQKRPDGSVEWLLVDTLVDLGPQETKSIFIEPIAGSGAIPALPAIAHPVTLREEGSKITLSNGLSWVTLSRDGGSLIKRLVVNGRTVVEEGQLVDLLLSDSGGKIFRASQSGAYKISVIHQNAVRTTVKLEGKHKARDGTTFMDFALRFELTANCPDVKFEHTFYCREPREGKLAIRMMKLVMPTTMDPASTKLIRQSHHGHTWFSRPMEIAENIEIVASSVGNIDEYASGFKGAAASHPCAGGSVFIRNMDSLHEDWSKYPFHMRPGQGSGFRADLQISGMRGVEPVIGWKSEQFTLVTAMEHFRQLHPKSIHIDENILTWSIWPDWSIPMQVVQGVSKSHIWWITGENRAMTIAECEDRLHRWEYLYVEPVDISFDPAWPAYCEALECQHLLKYQPEKNPMLENLIEPVPAAGNPNRHTYDRQPAIGMFHFGDHVNPDASSCANNEDDVNVLFPIQHFLRTGHTYAWDYGKESARHYMEVDFCEWSTDPRQRTGLIPHTGNHFVGNVYSSHQWSEGILAYYYLTGDERARNVVLGVAENHIYWAYNVTEAVTCDGREAGVPLVNLAAAYRLQPDERYIKAAKHICENFFVKYTQPDGKFEYPYPQSIPDHPYKRITGYGDWSSFAGLFRMWEVTGDEYFRTLGVQLLKQAIKPGAFSLNDVRGMDFLAAWALGVMTGDMDGVIKTVSSAIPMLLRRGGHPLRRMHFLNELDKRGMLDERLVGNRAGAI